MASKRVTIELYGLIYFISANLISLFSPQEAMKVPRCGPPSPQVIWELLPLLIATPAIVMGAIRKTLPSYRSYCLSRRGFELVIGWHFL
jgi:hypothetical protein